MAAVYQAKVRAINTLICGDYTEARKGSLDYDKKEIEDMLTLLFVDTMHLANHFGVDLATVYSKAISIQYKELEEDNERIKQAKERIVARNTSQTGV